MSADAHSHADAHVDSQSYGTLRGYQTGLGLAAILSAVALGLVAVGGIGGIQVTALVLLAIAIARIVVHLVYFLRVNSSAEGGWTVITTVFTVMVVVLSMIGSIWIMVHQEINMMPMPVPNRSVVNN